MRHQPTDVLVVVAVTCLILISICCCIGRSCYQRCKAARKRRMAVAERLIVNNDSHDDAIQSLLKKEYIKHIEHQHDDEGTNDKPELQEYHISIDKEGWMFLKFKPSKSYKKRYYFRFNGDGKRLWNFENETTLCCVDIMQLKHVLNVQQSTLNECEFIINSRKTKQMFFKCDTKQCRDDWCEILNKYCVSQCEDIVEADEGCNNDNANAKQRITKEAYNVENTVPPIPYAFAANVDELDV
eukprot:174219_1